jgi:phasin family protein
MAKDAKTEARTDALNPFAALGTMFEHFKLPGGDMSSLIDARRKDVEALVEANKAAYEAMLALAQTQTEMLTQSMQSMQEAAKGLAGGKGLGDPAKLGEGARDAWQKMLADMNKLAEMAHKSQAEAVAGLAQRAQQGIEGAKKAMTPK